MELQQFISQTLQQINDGLGEKSDCLLNGSVHFDLPLDTKGDQISVAFGDSAKIPGLPKITFDARPPMKVSPR